MSYLIKLCFFFLFIILIQAAFAQRKSTDTLIVGGAEYNKPRFYQSLWGTNRRLEWTTPVRVPILWLDTVYRGLTPFKTGGGNETKSLRLKTWNDKLYSLRSINKSRNDVVLPEFKHTFIEDIISDGISMSHPYGALAIPVMADEAGIYHTLPKIVYLPRQAELDTFNEKFGNDLYLFEQRPDGDWSDSKNMGNFKTFISTSELIDTLKSDNANRADQYLFAKSRLFDMLLADWDRHEDQWTWGLEKTSDKFLYKPVPRDRDQAFFTHNGFFIDRMIPAAGLGYMQNFDYDIKNVRTLNTEERNIDRFFTNELTLNDWINAAKDLQHSLTDLVIEKSIKQLPPEIYQISGKELIEKLKSRRDHLQTYATDYFLFLANDVQIIGSKKSEYFEINGVDSGKISVSAFAVNKDGEKNKTAFYSRIFYPNETKEVRLFGLDGNDVYHITGDASPIKIRLVGGFDKDTVIQQGSNTVHIYDDKDNVFQTTNARYHLSLDRAVHKFDYDYFNYDKKGFKFTVFYNNDDRLFIGAGYGFTKHRWRREPYATKQFIGLNYSISQKAISSTYTALFPNVFNHWDLSLYANYDAVRWTNFFGLGNETVVTTDDKNYFRMRTREWLVNTGLAKKIGKSNLNISAFFQSVKILSDSERYVAKILLPINSDAFETNDYLGTLFTYTVSHVNDSIVPTKGFTFLGVASYFYNTSQNEFFQKYQGKVQAYFPLISKFSLAVRMGAATVSSTSDVLNSAEFYEHAVIGGSENLRGFKRERFWGKTSFYNNNELRFISDIRTHLLNAKAGVFVFFDDGRVWMPQQNPGDFHTAYGGGILLAPFNKVCVNVTYGISKEAKLFQVRVNKLF